MIKTRNTIIVLSLMTVAIVLLINLRSSRQQTNSPQISSINVINLDRDIKRWNSMYAQGKNLGLTLNRFSAIYGKDIPYEKMRSLGIGNSMVRSNRQDSKNEKLNNLGVVGCYLSHRTLLEQLSTHDALASHGHLILEDDILLPSDFLQKNGRWGLLSKRIPEDWDIIFLRMWKPDGVIIAPGVMKLRSDPNKRTNLGAFAYIVRHGSIRSKILPWLDYMIDAYDEHLNLRFNSWNVYLLHPGIVDINDDLQKDSSINAINL